MEKKELDYYDYVPYIYGTSKEPLDKTVNSMPHTYLDY